MHNVELEIGSGPHRDEGIAEMALLEDGVLLSELDIQHSQLRELLNENSRTLEFLVLATAVYALDKTIPRTSAQDGWTRSLSLSIPVSDPHRWTFAASELTETINFLTGDHWTLQFTPLTNPILHPRGSLPQRSDGAASLTSDADSVSLFSGGLDSLVGVVDHLEQNASRLLLIGHHDPHIPGPLGDQMSLIEPLAATYPDRLRPIFLRVGQEPPGSEITLRSRSLLFIALGLHAATAIGPDVRLLIPENGAIALNFPLTPSRRGSCSTRTAHPHYLHTLSRALRQLGIGNALVNPLETKTKGEVVQECANPRLLRHLAPMTVSCAKRGHRAHWKRRHARSCGRCMPCIYRRAALHQLGRDSEVYGNDVCSGEIDLVGNDASGKDFRAVLSLLRRNLSPREAGNTLLANGPLDIDRLPRHAALVLRSIDEVRNLLRDKGRADVRRAAGLSD